MKQTITKLLTLLLLIGSVTACSGQKVYNENSKKQTVKTNRAKAHKKKVSAKKKSTKPQKKNVSKKITHQQETKSTPVKNAVLLPTEPYKKQVIATYYHDKFNGRKTANGTIFDNTRQTAAHRTLPFGTVVKVINRINGKWIYVTINDRGPVKKTREIDLTRRAFMDITDNPNKGELLVDIEIVKGN
ncbi:MAG: septal ring lytic transglycosylase RlpA family protein [Capnocytophaga felis]|nr:septal ring lytic transglycosylase RlpA family protein [Capnocytophaga felis]